MNENTVIDTQASRYLCFSLDKENFAIPLFQVKEVIGHIPLTPVPQAPPHFKGVINLRGTVISVIDLKQKLKVGKTDSKPGSTIVILDYANASVGIIVDDVNSVVEFQNSEISDPTVIQSVSKAKFISGVARTGDALTLILNVDSVLDAQELKLAKPSRSAS